jgi:hypothetical protein
MMSDKKRCTEEVFDGWEDTDRCLLDEHGPEIPHNFLCPGNGVKQKRRFRSNEAE